MSDLIGWYLTELRIQFGNRIDPATVEEILIETRSHLEEATRSIQDRGVPLETASRQTLLNFGEPATIANSYLSHSRRRRWPVSAITVMIISCFFGSFFLLIIPLVIKYDQPALIKCAAFCLIPTMLAGTVSRSVPLSKIAFVSSALGFGLIAFASLETYTIRAPYEIERPLRSRLTIVDNSIRSMIRQVDAYPEWSSKGKRIYAKSKSPADIPAEYKIKNSPYSPTFYKTPSVIRSDSDYLTNAVYSYEDAAREWSRLWNADLIGLRARLVAEDQQLRAEAERAINIDPELIAQTVGVVGISIFTHCLAAWLGKSLGRFRRRWHQVVYAR